MSLKLLIDAKRQRVLFAEADQRAVDFLSHFLTLPMSTILNLLDEHQLLGCIANLCQRDNKEEYYETLANPGTPVGYTCKIDSHNYFSDDPNAASACPRCGETMSIKMTYVAPPAAMGSGLMYMVMDDLAVKPIISTVSAVASLNKFNVKSANLEEKVVDLGLYEALELLKTSLSIPGEVLTTVFLKKEGKKNFKAMVAGIWSNDGSTQLDSTIHIKNLLSEDDDTKIASIQKVVEAGVVPHLIKFLLRDDFPQLQSEAAWVLGTIASGTDDHIKAVPRLVKLISSPNVGEVAVWALGNIAAGSQESRDLVLSHGALPPLLHQLNDEHTKMSMLRKATWTVSKLCDGDMKDCFDQLRAVALRVLEKLVVNSIDEEVLSVVCFTLSCLSGGSDDVIQAVIDSRVCPPLIELLQHPSPTVLLHALSTVGNVACGNNIQVQCILDHPDALSLLLKLLTGDHNMDIKWEACRTVSNITAGNKDQIQTVISSGISSTLISLIHNAESSEIKEMAALAVSNAIRCGGTNQIKCLVRQGCINPLCDLLACPDPNTLKVCLKGLKELVDYAQMIVDAEGLDKIRKLENHDDNDICKLAKFISSAITASASVQCIPG